MQARQPALHGGANSPTLWFEIGGKSCSFAHFREVQADSASQAGPFKARNDQAIGSQAMVKNRFL